MDFLADLWLPILLSAVFCFIASSIIHMVIPLHRSDFKKLPAEGQILDAMRPHALKPGEYMFPCPKDMKDMGSPEMLAKFEQGPVGHMTILPNGPFNIGRSLGFWLVYLLVISTFVAYLASQALTSGAGYLQVFQVTGTGAFLAYVFSNVPNSIWRGTPWSTTAKFMFDGLVYSLVTAGTFGWLWS
ncbi:MAG: hypothetical protein RL885_10770 [Planctomycetota bacterium]